MQLRGHKKEEPVIKAGAVQSDINVTPLVDVCLVLLIIFMVVTPLLQKGVDVALPETTRPEKMPENEQQLVVAVKMDGSVFVGPGLGADQPARGDDQEDQDGIAEQGNRGQGRQATEVQGGPRSHEGSSTTRASPRSA